MSAAAVLTQPAREPPTVAATYGDPGCASRPAGPRCTTRPGWRLWLSTEQFTEARCCGGRHKGEQPAAPDRSRRGVAGSAALTVRGQADALCCSLDSPAFGLGRIQVEGRNRPLGGWPVPNLRHVTNVE